MVFAPKSYFSTFYQKIEAPFRSVFGGGGASKIVKNRAFFDLGWSLGGLWGSWGGFGALGEAPESTIRDAKDYFGALN